MIKDQSGESRSAAGLRREKGRETVSTSLANYMGANKGKPIADPLFSCKGGGVRAVKGGRGRGLD